MDIREKNIYVYLHNEYAYNTCTLYMCIVIPLYNIHHMIIYIWIYVCVYIYVFYMYIYILNSFRAETQSSIITDS